ncbi:spore coat protein CotJC [Acutalibacter sp. 1XD8-33]|nr:spore coat protein CotJC [Acutalibacter sp. 1XD8-33]
MFVYEKRLQHPVRIKNPNPKLAKIIITQYGGPHGEIGASLRYLSQRYSMPYPELAAILTDIGSEASEMEFSEASVFLAGPLCVPAAFTKAPVTPFATVKLHLCGSIFK